MAGITPFHFQILSEIRGLQAKRTQDKEANLRAAMPNLNDFTLIMARKFGLKKEETAAAVYLETLSVRAIRIMTACRFMFMLQKNLIMKK